MLVNPAGMLEFTVGRGPGQTTLSGDTFQTSRKIPEEVFATAEPQLVGDLHDEMFAEAHLGTTSKIAPHRRLRKTLLRGRDHID